MAALPEHSWDPRVGAEENGPAPGQRAGDPPYVYRWLRNSGDDYRRQEKIDFYGRVKGRGRRRAERTSLVRRRSGEAAQKQNAETTGCGPDRSRGSVAGADAPTMRSGRESAAGAETAVARDGQRDAESVRRGAGGRHAAGPQTPLSRPHSHSLYHLSLLCSLLARDQEGATVSLELLPVGILAWFRSTPWADWVLWAAVGQGVLGRFGSDFWAFWPLFQV